MVNSTERSYKRTLDMGPTPKPLKRLRFDVDGQDEANGRWVEIPPSGGSTGGVSLDSPELFVL